MSAVLRNMESSIDFSDRYDIFTSSDDYAGRFESRAGRWFLAVQEQMTLRMIGSYSNPTVLDVGGGHGQITDALVRKGCRVTVLGSSEECKSRIQPFIDKGLVDFTVGDLTHMPYPDQEFDIVISYRLMAHMTSWSAFLVEMMRVARKAVVFDYPELRSINSIAPYLYSLKKRLEPNTRKFQCFREGELLEVLREVGFHRVDHSPQFFLPMALHRKINQPGLSSAVEKFFRFSGLTSLLGSPVIERAERT